MARHARARIARARTRARVARVAVPWTALALLDTTDKAVRGTTGEQCRDM